MQTIKSQSFQEQLTENLYVPVVLDLEKQDIDDAINAFLTFTQLPDEYKVLANHRLNERRNTRFGWMPHGRSNGDDETAAIYHHGLLSQQVAEGRSATLPHDLKTFLDIAQKIHMAGVRATKACLKLAGPEAPQLLGEFFPDNPSQQPWNTHLRFIAYEASPDGRLTTGHFDQSSATLAIAESHPGLQMGHDDNDLSFVKRAAHESLFFTGSGWKKLFAHLGIETNIEPAWHNVLQLPEHGVNETYLRWAIVQFINPAVIDTSLTREETHAGAFVA